MSLQEAAKPTYEELAKALIDVLDGNADPDEIDRNTGLGYDRCAEICEVFSRVCAYRGQPDPLRLRLYLLADELTQRGMGDAAERLLAVLDGRVK